MELKWNKMMVKLANQVVSNLFRKRMVRLQYKQSNRNYQNDILRQYLRHWQSHTNIEKKRYQ